MEFSYATYNFSPILGWSISRYELFDKCKRQYFYNYYSKFVPGVPLYKVKQLKELTSVPLEIGNVVHDIMETLLKRLQKSDADINTQKFIEYSHVLAHDYFSRKTFIELHYKKYAAIEMDNVYQKIDLCLNNFLTSSCFNWIFMKALTNKHNWMIEPAGYGETRLNGLKAYCKMDFLFPVDDVIYILDWKTGKKNTFKHSAQLIGYAAATHENFKVPFEKIYPKIIYLSPVFDELEFLLRPNDLETFFETVKHQSLEMYNYCVDIEKNIPRAMEEFPKTPSMAICECCNYQELCLPDLKATAFGLD